MKRILALFISILLGLSMMFGFSFAAEGNGVDSNTYINLPIMATSTTDWLLNYAPDINIANGQIDLNSDTRYIIYDKVDYLNETVKFKFKFTGLAAAGTGAYVALREKRLGSYWNPWDNSGYYLKMYVDVNNLGWLVLSRNNNEYTDSIQTYYMGAYSINQEKSIEYSVVNEGSDVRITATCEEVSAINYLDSSANKITTAGNLYFGMPGSQTGGKFSVSAVDLGSKNYINFAAAATSKVNWYRNWDPDVTVANGQVALNSDNRYLYYGDLNYLNESVKFRFKFDSISDGQSAYVGLRFKYGAYWNPWDSQGYYIRIANYSNIAYLVLTRNKNGYTDWIQTKAIGAYTAGMEKDIEYSIVNEGSAVRALVICDGDIAINYLDDTANKITTSGYLYMATTGVQAGLKCTYKALDTDNRSYIDLMSATANKSDWNINWAPEQIDIANGIISINQCDRSASYGNYLNEAVKFKFRFDKFDVNNGGIAYVGLRKQIVTYYNPWDENGYYLQIKISNGKTLLTLFKKSTEVNYTQLTEDYILGDYFVAQESELEFAAIDEGDAVRLTVKHAGNVIVNYLDTTNLITESGQFYVDNRYYQDGVIFKLYDTSAKPNYILTSSVYNVINGKISGITENTLVSTFSSNLILPTGTIKVVNQDESDLSLNQTLIGTGMKVQLKVNEIVNDQKTVIIYGDVNGDGLIAVNDLILIKQKLLRIDNFINDDCRLAGDITNKGSISISDLLAIKKHILNIKSIVQS